MKWNVYNYDFNSNEIIVFNIFEHGTFLKYIKDAIKESTSKEEFAKKLKAELQYYFWSKCEYEVLVSPWIGRKEPVQKKIDVYDQIMNNWHVFVDYVYNEATKEMLGLED